MDAQRLVVIGASVAVATIAVALTIGSSGPGRARQVLLVWTVLTFLVVGLFFALRPRI